MKMLYLPLMILLSVLGVSCTRCTPEASQPSNPQASPAQAPVITKTVIKPGLTLGWAKHLYRELRLTCEAKQEGHIGKGMEMSREVQSMDWDVLKDFSSGERSFQKHSGFESHLEKPHIVTHIDSIIKVRPRLTPENEIDFDVEVEGKTLNDKYEVIKTWSSKDLSQKKTFLAFERKNRKIRHTITYECVVHRVPVSK
jgi:hypothetical protein